MTIGYRGIKRTVERLATQGFHFKVERGWKVHPRHTGEWSVVVEYLTLDDSPVYENGYGYVQGPNLPLALAQALVRCWHTRRTI